MTSYGAVPLPRNRALPYVPAPYWVHVPRVNVCVEAGPEVGDDAVVLVLVVGVVVVELVLVVGVVVVVLVVGVVVVVLVLVVGAAVEVVVPEPVVVVAPVPEGVGA